MLAALLLVRFFDVPLSFGFFSLALPLTFWLNLLSGPGPTLGIIGAGLLWRRPRPREWLCDLLPSGLLSLGLWAAPHSFPALDPVWILALVLSALPFPVVLRHQLGGPDQADYAALQWEVLALGALGPLAGGLWLVWKPGLVLLPFFLMALRSSARRGLRLYHFQEGRVDLRQQRRGLALQEQAVEERAQAFLMLETLSLACKTQDQAVEEVLNLLHRRFPNCSCAYEKQGQVLRSRGPQPPAGAPVRSWPLGADSALKVFWRDNPSAEIEQNLEVLLRYTGLLLERAEFQAHLLASLHTMEQLLGGAARLSGEVASQGILQQAVGLAEQLSGQPVTLNRTGLYSLGAAGGLTPAGPVSPHQNEALALWAHLVRNALERNLQQGQLIQAGKLAAIGQLAAGVAHELNTPLGAITLALTSALQSLQSRPERAQTRLEQALKASAQMQQIVSKLLHYARESGTGFRRLQLREVVEDSLQLLQHALQGDGVQVEQQLAAVEVKGDAGQLQQIVVNLLNNARLAAPHGRVAIDLTCEQGEAVVRVSDSGAGVTEEIADRIFEPFFTTREVGQGTGLGLSLSRQIAEQHHGSLRWLCGSTFELRLPAWS